MLLRTHLAVFAVVMLLLAGCANNPSTGTAQGTEPTDEPADDPTAEPTEEPADEPTADPTEEPTDEPMGEPTEEPTQEPTGEPTEEPTGEPTEEPTDEPTEEPTDEPTDEPTGEPAELDDLRTVGGPAEALVPANEQDDIDNWLHEAWGIDRFVPSADETSEWANRDELWDDIVNTTWERAVDEYGDRLRHEPGTIWDGTGGDSPGENIPRPAYGTYGHSAVENDHGYLMDVWVGVEPDDPDQNRPDAAVYTVQVLGQEEAPQLWHGELHRVAGMCVISGELTWGPPSGGDVWDAINDCDSADLDEQPWETVEEIRE